MLAGRGVGGVSVCRRLAVAAVRTRSRSSRVRSQTQTVLQDAVMASSPSQPASTVFGRSPPELVLRRAAARSMSTGGTPGPHTYRAAMVTELGKPLEIVTQTTGPLLADCVAVDIHHAAVNFGDLLMVKGAYQVKPPLPFTPGTEFSGVVTAVGEDVSSLSPGDHVLGVMGIGSFAERAVVPATTVQCVPAGVSSEVACSVLVVYGTAMLALGPRRAALGPSDTVLVTAAAGGVGLAAVDLAANYFKAARVIGACSSDAKCAVVRERGATATINYSTESLSERVRELTDGRGADVIVDNVGGDLFKECLRSAAFEGRLLVIGFTSGTIPRIPANVLLLKSCTVQGVYWGDYRNQKPDVFHRSIQDTLAAVASGQAKPHVSKVFPLSQVNDALKFVADRKSTGKVVLDCQSGRK